MRPPETERWLDRRQNISKVYLGVWIVCAMLLVVEPLVHKHGAFPIETWPGFHGIFGFVACVGLVLAAKALRRWLKRPADYYDRR